MTTPTGKILFLDCFSGVSGDMFVGALADLGVPPSALEWETGKLGLAPAHLHFDRESRNGIQGVRFRVHEGAHCHSGGEEHEHHDHAHDHGHSHDHECHGHGHDHEHGHEHQHTHGRSFAEIRRLIEESALSDFVKTRAVAVFRRIAVAEGKIHGLPPDQVAFHEVGAVDSIMDIVAACAGIEHLGCPAVFCSPLVEGSGFVRCAHGTFPVPAPATLEILRGIPLRQEEDPGERITPTGAALVAEFAAGFGPMPEMALEKIGYGVGARHHKTRPNVLRAVLGSAPQPGSIGMDSVVSLEANVDDATPQQLGAALNAIMAAGALDVAILPAQMKKGRPGHLITALCAPGAEREIAAAMLRETGTFGVRFTTMGRFKLERSSREVATRFGPVSVKEGFLGGERLRAAPEFESCAAAAAKAGAPFRAVFDEALAEALRER